MRGGPDDWPAFLLPAMPQLCGAEVVRRHFREGDPKFLLRKDQLVGKCSERVCVIRIGPVCAAASHAIKPGTLRGRPASSAALFRASKPGMQRRIIFRASKPGMQRRIISCKQARHAVPHYFMQASPACSVASFRASKPGMQRRIISCKQARHAVPQYFMQASPACSVASFRASKPGMQRRIISCKQARHAAPHYFVQASPACSAALFRVEKVRHDLA